jgi:hypothetical protein
MKKTALVFLSICFIAFSCKKEEAKSEQFLLLTGPVWEAVTLLVNGADAGGPGGLLESLDGDAIFNENGTGTFGTYTGTWYFFDLAETQIMISPDTEPWSLLCTIEELSATTLIIAAIMPNDQNPSEPLDIRIIFEAK